MLDSPGSVAESMAKWKQEWKGVSIYEKAFENEAIDHVIKKKDRKLFLKKE